MTLNAKNEYNGKLVDSFALFSLRYDLVLSYIQFCPLLKQFKNKTVCADICCKRMQHTHTTAEDEKQRQKIETKLKQMIYTYSNGWYTRSFVSFRLIITQSIIASKAKNRTECVCWLHVFGVHENHRLILFIMYMKTGP